VVEWLKNNLEPGEFIAGGVDAASRAESVKPVERGDDWNELYADEESSDWYILLTLLFTKTTGTT